MVVIQVKRSDTDLFLVESSTTESVDLLVRRLVNIWNTRLRLMQLVESVRDMAKYGPSKPPAEHGLDEASLNIRQYEGACIEKGPHYQPDPTGKRTGNGVSPQLCDTLERVCVDAEALLGKEQAQRRVAITQAALDEKMDNIRGAVTMAFPMGLPEFDPVRLTIEGGEGLEGTQAGTEVLDEDTAGLWMAGKEFRRDQAVGDRVGKNEKTRVMCKLQNPGSGPPGREPGVSEAERKAMMAFYFKRQEELKRLAEANDDDYLGSAWADPKQLQRSLRGTGSVRAPGV
ncbi:unnamed protein product [Pylaiella littoralis]